MVALIFFAAFYYVSRQNADDNNQNTPTDQSEVTGETEEESNGLVIEALEIKINDPDSRGLKYEYNSEAGEYSPQYLVGDNLTGTFVGCTGYPANIVPLTGEDAETRDSAFMVGSNWFDLHTGEYPQSVCSDEFYDYQVELIDYIKSNMEEI